MTLNDAIDEYHAAADQFSRGDPNAAKAIFSRRDDVTIANPWGPAVCGWKQVSEALDHASSQFRDGKVLGFDFIASYKASDLATILEVERWAAKVSGRNEVSLFDLRVTTTFRLEESLWRVVHRHADPITTPNPRGPLPQTET